MKQFRLSKAAKNDLRQIWREGMDTWGEPQTESYLRSLDACFHLLGDQPAMGHHCDELRQGYRCFPKGAHFIYYYPSADDILIVRIRPQRMLPLESMLNEGM